MTRQQAKAADDSRPFNNLLRHLNDSDFALVEPFLETISAKADDLLYNPGDDLVPLTHEQLSTMLEVGRSYSRVIQAFKAESILETRRGAILIRNHDALAGRSCLCNDAVKAHFDEVLRGVYLTGENRA